MANQRVVTGRPERRMLIVGGRASAHLPVSVPSAPPGAGHRIGRTMAHRCIIHALATFTSVVAVLTLRMKVIRHGLPDTVRRRPSTGSSTAVWYIPAVRHASACKKTVAWCAAQHQMDRPVIQPRRGTCTVESPVPPYQTLATLTVTCSSSSSGVTGTTGVPDFVFVIVKPFPASFRATVGT